MRLLVNSRGVLPRSQPRSQAGAWECNSVDCCLRVSQGGGASIAAFLASGKERDMRGQTLSQFTNSMILFAQ
jgi:hypothetical protein